METVFARGTQKVKVKFTLELTMKAQRGSRDRPIALYFFNLGSRWRRWVTNATPRPL
jgi:hypothetical protein